MNLKKFGKVLTSKSVGTGPSSYEKRIYRAAVSQRLRNTGIGDNGHNIGHGSLATHHERQRPETTIGAKIRTSS